MIDPKQLPEKNDQTIFQHEEPFLASEKKPPRFQVTKKQKIIFAILSSTIVALTVLLFILSGSEQKSQQLPLSPTPSSQSTSNKSSVDLLFDELEVDMNEADPSKQLYTFPPLRSQVSVSSDR